MNKTVLEIAEEGQLTFMEKRRVVKEISGSS